MGVAAGRPRRPRPALIPPPPANCSRCSTATSLGSWPRCSAPNATWPAPAYAAADGDPVAGAAFAAAITGLRQHSTPYHLAHGLLDHAAHLAAHGDTAGRRGCYQRSPRHRPAAALPDAGGPRGHHPARPAPHRGLVTTASASPGPARRREPGHFPQRPAPLGNATPRSRYAATPGPRPASNPTQRRQPQTREAYS